MEQRSLKSNGETIQFFQHQNTEGKIKIQKLDVHGFHQFGDSGKTLIKNPCYSTSSGYFGIKND